MRYIETNTDGTVLGRELRSGMEPGNDFGQVGVETRAYKMLETIFTETTLLTKLVEMQFHSRYQNSAS